MKKEKEKQILFAICLDNEGYKASLEVGKLYQIIPDNEADDHGYIRVIYFGPYEFVKIRLWAKQCCHGRTILRGLSMKTRAALGCGDPMEYRGILCWKSPYIKQSNNQTL